MQILAKTSENTIATVFVADINGKKVEFVESIQPPRSINEKWVLIISTLYGCPVSCKFCDSGGFFDGKITKEDMFAQIEHMINFKFPNGIIDTEKFKIQFARMGEPAMNSAVLGVLEELPGRLDLTGKFYPSISTIAPKGKKKFFDRLLSIKNDLYKDTFQMQFSIHSTSEAQRDVMMPLNKWSFKEIAEYSEKFFQNGTRKITLNFALAAENEFDINILKQYFDPNIFLIKMTPVNPTFRAESNSIITSNAERIINICKDLNEASYETIYSIGELEENNIGSNCGQYITNYLNQSKKIDAYTYRLEAV